MKIFLDDIRCPTTIKFPPNVPEGKWTIVKTYDEFRDVISEYYRRTKRMPEFISFDHDLEDAEFCSTLTPENGATCASFLKSFCKTTKQPLPAFHIHSMSEEGREAIYNILTRPL